VNCRPGKSHVQYGAPQTRRRELIRDHNSKLWLRPRRADTIWHVRKAGGPRNELMTGWPV
jgi:hypothetical protein